MTINPDLERDLALVVERESLAVAVRVLRLLYAEVVRLDQHAAQLERKLEIVGSELDTMRRIMDINTGLHAIYGERVELLELLHTNARPGHGYATMAGEHSTPIERAVHAYTTDKAVTEYLASKERDYWAKE